MALRDYKLCDRCGSKVFYDADLSYEHGDNVDGKWVYPEDPFKVAGEVQVNGTGLGYLGDWAVLCTGCSKTHKTVIQEI